jgi:glycosyltransferase involved in cell wall biosynthesis
MLPHRDGTTVWPGIPAPAHSSPARLGELRAALGLGDRPVVGVVGRLVGWKGQDKLIRAAAQLRAQGIDVDVLVVGGETHGVEAGIDDRLHRLAAETGMSERVHFTGHVQEPLPYIEIMDVFVSASDGEPFGIVLLEAMALEIPVVAVAKGGPVDIVEHGVSGWLVPTNEPDDLASGIGPLLADQRLRARIASGGLGRYRDAFREERMLADLRRTLQGLAQEIDGAAVA